LGTQDLMTVTKKSSREAVASQFPDADLSDKKEFLNSSIDTFSLHDFSTVIVLNITQ